MGTFAKAISLVVIIAGILTTVWLTGYHEGKNHGMKKVADVSLKKLHDMLSDGAILWIQGGAILQRKGNELRDYLLDVIEGKEK